MSDRLCLLQTVHVLRAAFRKHVEHLRSSGANARKSTKRVPQSGQVSQLLHRLWKLRSSSLFVARNSEADFHVLQAVHLYGHASGAHE